MVELVWYLVSGFFLLGPLVPYGLDVLQEGTHVAALFIAAAPPAGYVVHQLGRLAYELPARHFLLWRCGFRDAARKAAGPALPFRDVFAYWEDFLSESYTCDHVSLFDKLKVSGDFVHSLSAALLGCVLALVLLGFLPTEPVPYPKGSATRPYALWAYAVVVLIILGRIVCLLRRACSRYQLLGRHWEKYFAKLSGTQP